jgi:hypothetical protein
MTTSVPPSPPSAGYSGQAEHPPRLSEPTPRRYTVLANHEERLQEARRLVWRDRDEPAVEIHDLWECLEHGALGGLRTSSSIY